LWAPTVSLRHQNKSRRKVCDARGHPDITQREFGRRIFESAGRPPHRGVVADPGGFRRVGGTAGDPGRRGTRFLLTGRSKCYVTDKEGKQ